MSGERRESIMQGRDAYKGVASALEKLAIDQATIPPPPPPLPTGHSVASSSAGHPGSQRKGSHPSPPPPQQPPPPPPPHKASSSKTSEQQTVIINPEEEPRSEESSTSGLCMHPIPVRAVDDGNGGGASSSLTPPPRDFVDDFDADDSEEGRDSLPAPVLQLEKLGSHTSSQSQSQSSEQNQDLAHSAGREASSPHHCEGGSGNADGSSGSGSLSAEGNIPNWAYIMPNSNTSDYSRGTGHRSGEEEEEEGRGRGGGEDELSPDTKSSLMTIEQFRVCVQGFVFKSPKDLNDYLRKIVTNQRDFGIYVFDKLNPRCVDGVNVYRPGKEFIIVKNLLPLDYGCGVFLCEDCRSKHQFILKKIMKSNHRLIGTEFLAQHRQTFLPKIYGIYKDRDTISIFQEYIEGCTLNGDISWNFAKVRQMAQMLLTAVQYLHQHNLVHFDIKLRNLTVRDKDDPNSLVMIDFESSKHSAPCYIWKPGGFTLTYLPPWHEMILSLDAYHPILKTADLWAVACVVIFFLMPVERSANMGVWGQVHRKIRSTCQGCRQLPQGGRHCHHCRNAFLGHVKKHGHRVLELHLGILMERHGDDPNWQALKKTLTYLTDTANVETKHVDMALQHIRGTQGYYYQAAIEFGDVDIHG